MKALPVADDLDLAEAEPDDPANPDVHQRRVASECVGGVSLKVALAGSSLTPGP